MAPSGRRITPTPLGIHSPGFHTSHVTPDSSWDTNAAFTNQLTLSERATSLSEERQLLQQERRRRQRYGSHKASVEKDGSHKVARVGGKEQHSERRGESEGGALSRCARGHSSQKSHSIANKSFEASLQEEMNIDSKLESHSIFDLNSSSRGRHSTKSYNSLCSQNASSRLSSAHQGLHNISCGTPPLTSTPVVGVVHGHAHVCPEAVTQRGKLDSLAGLYASLITGNATTST